VCSRRGEPYDPHEDKPVAKALSGMRYPAHNAAQERDEEHVDFGARPAWVTTLAVVRMRSIS